MDNRRIIMIDDEGDEPQVIRYARTLTMPYGFVVGPRKPQEYESLSDGIFTDVGDFLGYVDYLLSPSDSEAQRELMEICAFIIDQQMPPGDRLVRVYPEKQLAKNHPNTGAVPFMTVSLTK